MTGRRLEAVLRRRVTSDALLRELATAASDCAAALYLVGGYVRDAALGRRARDLDLLCAHGTARVVARLRELWGSRGFRFRKRGITTWRFVSRGRQVDLVDAGRRGLLDDLRRRELTFNAIAFDLAARRLHDPLHGLADLRAGRMRPPRDGVLRDDPLRALRAARFAAEYPSFSVAAALRREARTVGPALRRASAERVRDELGRLLEAPAPQRGLALLRELGLAPAVLPELEPLAACTAGRDRRSVWEHTLDALSLSTPGCRLPGAPAVRDASRRRILRWALLLHDISKPETLALDEADQPTFHGHEARGARRADALLRRLKMPRAPRRRIARLVLLHLRPSHLADAGAPPRGMRRLVREAGEDLPLLVLHAACDARASTGPAAAARWRRLRAVLLELLDLDRPRAIPPRLVDGRDVMRLLAVAPGPEVGRVLEELAELQDTGALSSREEALDYLARLRDRAGR